MGESAWRHQYRVWGDGGLKESDLLLKKCDSVPVFDLTPMLRLIDAFINIDKWGGSLNLNPSDHIKLDLAKFARGVWCSIPRGSMSPMQGADPLKPVFWQIFENILSEVSFDHAHLAEGILLINFKIDAAVFWWIDFHHRCF